MNFEGLSGLLLSDRRNSKLESSSIVRAGRVSEPARFEDSAWEQASFQSEVPFTPADQLGTPPFTYPLVWRLSGPRVLLLSISRDVVEHFRKVAVKSGLRLEPVGIAVDLFVKETARDPSEYVLSFVHARVSAFGTALKSVSFYGEDVAEAKFFRDGMDLFVCHTCGVRHAAGGGEIIRLGNDGAVSFKHTGSRRLREVEETLGHLRRNGYLARTKIEEGEF